MKHMWIKSFSAAIIVCDKKGLILEMNDKAIESFSNEGGKKLIGTNLLECHPEPARTRLAGMLNSQEQNVYTVEKNGIKSFICQSPWYDKGVYSGFVEISFTVPAEIPHIVRT